jgi:NNP family nitrate/nitrite transporter-like MFS transporter
LAALAGIGGGNFASSMANINSFYPQRLKGWALGLNAGGGNIGVAAVQLAGLAVLATAGKAHPRILVGIYLPLIVVGAALSALLMDNLAQVRNERHAMRDASRDPHTWILALLYVGAFGSFIGFGFAFGQVLLNQFGGHFLTAGKVDPVKIAYLTFLGPLVGSLIRPLGGWLADRVGGARTTVWNFVVMALAATLVLVASRQASLGLFYVGFIALFVLSGIGNGSIYKMIPAVFLVRYADEHEARRLANAVIGIAGAVGAFGGVLVNIAFRQSFLAYSTGDAAYLAFIGFYLACTALTWWVYLRPAARVRNAGL